MMAAVLRCGLVVGPLAEIFGIRAGSNKKRRRVVVGHYGRFGGLVVLRSAGMEDWDSMEWHPISGKHVEKIPALDIVHRFEIPAVQA